ncbi:hypothetical protein [Allosphingosinicella sp.]|uniref:hypothetical protein n=1 Tax=Allosphingosinicella sp. TaxID=2823234 RepID=UPI002F06E329
MFNFNQIAQTAVAALGALMLTSVAVGAAIGPATTSGPAPTVFAAAGSPSNA